MGRLDEASVWVSRALTVEEMDPDAGVSLGDLYAGGQRWDEAKKCYEKVIVKVSHQPSSGILLYPQEKMMTLWGIPDLPQYTEASVRRAEHPVIDSHVNAQGYVEMYCYIQSVMTAQTRLQLHLDNLFFSFLSSSSLPLFLNSFSSFLLHL